ncbi:MAG: peptide/nickel transport system ATP-binding protein [Gaiellaceae bacterium]|nr:peptide/nickel transport system ATP-binding protein [Gaiellaceae bacterium]
MSAGEQVLSVSGLRTVFAARGGAVTAVRDVDLDVSPGEKVGIVGESGSGKSALALSILGLIEPPGRVVGGSVRLNGQELVGLGDRELGNVRGRDIGIVFQDPLTSLNPVKKIGTQLYEAIRRHHPRLRKHEVRRRALELLHDVEISSPERRLDDFPHHYSGGMRQRVLIAIALANRPAVLIADEPTTALDTTTQAHVLWLLDRLVTEHGTAVILITHNLGVVAEFCDSVHVMYAGRFVESASTPALFANQIHPYTEALLGSILRPDRLEEGPLAAIPGAPPDLADLPPGCPFEPRCAFGNGREICQTVRPEPVTLTGILHGSSEVECHFAEERAARGELAAERT